MAEVTASRKEPLFLATDAFLSARASSKHGNTWETEIALDMFFDVRNRPMQISFRKQVSFA